MSKKPEVDHEYDSGKDRLTITIHRYSLKKKTTRHEIIQTLIANLEAKSDHKKSKKKVRNKKFEVTTDE